MAKTKVQVEIQASPKESASGGNGEGVNKKIGLGKRNLPEVTNAVDSGKKRKRNKKKSIQAAVDDDGTVGGFTVLGDASTLQNQNVKRVLPNWLANPSIISCNLKDSKVQITTLGLDSELVNLLEANFIPYFFPVQYQVIPSLVKSYTPTKLYRPSDLCISAPTGSGKTLAYVLPLVQILKKRSLVPRVRAIVVVPTEVLATQVYTVFDKFSKGSGLRIFLMSKRLTVSAERDALICKSVTGKLTSPHDIVIATPGRLVDHLEKTPGFDVSQLQFLVVDEADRTLDDQEGDWLNRLESKFWSHHPVPGIANPWKSIPLTLRWNDVHLKAYQKLLFSATLSQNPETLEKLHLFQPKLLTSIVEKREDEDSKREESATPVNVSDSFVGKFTTPLELKESFVLCHKDTKPLILSYLISHFKWKRVLCFTNTKEGTHRLCLLLKYLGNLNVKEISAKWTPKARDMALKNFSNGSIDILVTSDQLARGIDIPTVDYVISYDLPGYTKTYIHRVGRCARAGRTGHALSLVMENQIGVYKKTMKSAGKTNFERIIVKNSDLKELEEKFKVALAQVKTTVTEEDSGKRKKSKPANLTPDKTSMKKSSRSKKKEKET